MLDPDQCTRRIFMNFFYFGTKPEAKPKVGEWETPVGVGQVLRDLGTMLVVKIREPEREGKLELTVGVKEIVKRFPVNRLKKMTPLEYTLMKRGGGFAQPWAF